jgi:enolase
VSAICRVHAREVLDSRGNPTVQVEIGCGSGAHASAMVPAGASTGKAEAHELRDGEPGRYEGRGVRKAVGHVNDIIAPAIMGRDPTDQAGLDRLLGELDGTANKSRLGANAVLGVSLASAHAAAADRRLPLYHHLHEIWLASWSAADAKLHTPHATHTTPRHRPAAGCRLPLPMTNMISGGLHAGGNLDFQDFLIAPVGAPDYRTGLEWIVRVARRLSAMLRASGFEGRLVADEGGYGPRLPTNRIAIEFVARAIVAAGLRPKDDVTIALDVASSHFFDGRHYRLRATGDERLTSSQMVEQLVGLVDDFPFITSIEDGLAEEDWNGWRELTERLGSRVALVGDDLFATNPERIGRGIELGAANAVLIKVNQIGTLSETFAAMRVARAAGYASVVSARSGETEDTTIADLAVATGADLIKIGSIQRSERLAKYNRLLVIEEELMRGDGRS